MKRNLAAVAATLGLLVSAGTAVAATPADQAAQAAGQAAGSGQTAGALSGASQSRPANQNISVRVLSPGNGGDVTQANTVDSGATAANANHTGQTAGQAQGSGCCGGGTQAVGQSADSDQAAAALSVATQHGASNGNIPVRVLSPGHDGDVSQANSVESDATAANANATGQSADQAAGGSGTQAIGQSASSDQDAAAASKAEQSGAKNTNIAVRVLSPGDDGSVDQSNSVSSSATAANLNLAGQQAGQAQGGSGGTQAIGQKAQSGQTAGALSAAEQQGATNTNVPVRVLSHGDSGDVTQSNAVASSATAANLNGTKQGAGQTQAGRGCECAAGGIQAVGQDATSDQTALAASAAKQAGASNTNTPVRVGSNGHDGDVEQSNSVASSAAAGNLNVLAQDADQAQAGGDCRCGAGGTQAIGQSAKSEQGALAASLAEQANGHGDCRCSPGGNTNAPVRVDSHGGGGSVDQSNSVESSATAANLNGTMQHAAQGQGGSGIQAIGQAAHSHQGAVALSAAAQHGASNTNAPVRVGSNGPDGEVSQSNGVASSAAAANANLTGQKAAQVQRGGECGCHGGLGIQALGQEAASYQGAMAASLAAQAGASNANAPVRVDSHGGGGSVEQSNDVSSAAVAANLNALHQDADQHQAAGGGIAIQALGQSAYSRQHAIGLSAALQHGASNSSTPAAVGSRGGGDVTQSNAVASHAAALNANWTHQDADQQQAQACRCAEGLGIQALGQQARSSQGALAASLAAQLNPIRGRWVLE